MKPLAALVEDDELLLLSSLYMYDVREIDKGKRLVNMDELRAQECHEMFRFEQGDIKRLHHALRMPAKIVCPNGTVAHGIEGLLIMLRRLVYPNRLSDLTHLFQRSESELSYIINETVRIVYDTHSHLLRDLGQDWLSRDNLEGFANVVQAAGSPLHNCWGFIDGTVRPICRPTYNQRYLFTGHKRLHGLKFQSITTPNGLIANMFGTIEGRRHDSGMLTESGLLPQLEQHMTMADGNVYSLYGDPAYPLKPHLIAPFRGANLSAQERLFNKRMSAVRTSVEWNFGKVVTLFGFLDFKRNLKLYLQPVAKYYLVGALLTNCHTCLYGNETSSFFGVDPPVLEAYLQ